VFFELKHAAGFHLITFLGKQILTYQVVHMREIIDGTISILDRFCRKGVMGGPSHEVPDDIAFAYAQVGELLKSMTSQWNWRWTAISNGHDDTISTFTRFH